MADNDEIVVTGLTADLQQFPRPSQRYVELIGAQVMHPEGIEDGQIALAMPEPVSQNPGGFEHRGQFRMAPAAPGNKRRTECRAESQFQKIALGAWGRRREHVHALAQMA